MGNPVVAAILLDIWKEKDIIIEAWKRMDAIEERLREIMPEAPRYVKPDSPDRQKIMDTVRRNGQVQSIGKESK